MIVAAPLLAALALAGCKDEPQTAPAAKGAAKAVGDVKGGSLSDAMVPLDQLKSKSPALKIDPEDKGTTVRPDSGAGAAPDGNDQAEAPVAAEQAAPDSNPAASEAAE
ncbi:MAG: hypothetical protein R3E18_03810 [Sphingomonadaceae bacterium]